jgi:hypothetical protein
MGGQNWNAVQKKHWKDSRSSICKWEGVQWVSYCCGPLVRSRSSGRRYPRRYGGSVRLGYWLHSLAGIGVSRPDAWTHFYATSWRVITSWRVTVCSFFTTSRTKSF